MTTAQVNDFYRRHDPENPFRDPSLPVIEFKFPFWRLLILSWLTVMLLLGVGMLAGMTWTLDFLGEAL